jgi:hypothetical protein
MDPLVGEGDKLGARGTSKGVREVRQTEEAVRGGIRGRSSGHKGGHVAQPRRDRTAGDKLGTRASRCRLGPEMKRQ